MITAHNEGAKVANGISAVKQSISRVTAGEVELLIALDRPSGDTLKCVMESGVDFIETNYADVGQVRNYVLDTVAKNFEGVFFMDADDGCCPHWIPNALTASLSAAHSAIISPTSRIHVWRFFGKSFRLRFAQPEATISRRLKKWALNRTNLWGSMMLIKGLHSESLRFPVESDGSLFEDWEFNRRSLDLGVERITALGTHYYNQAKGSRRRLQGRQSWSKSLMLGPAECIYSVSRHLIRKIAGLAILAFYSRPMAHTNKCNCDTR